MFEITFCAGISGFLGLCFLLRAVESWRADAIDQILFAQLCVHGKDGGFRLSRQAEPALYYRALLTHALVGLAMVTFAICMLSN